jgi:hypothetical protein
MTDSAAAQRWQHRALAPRRGPKFRQPRQAVADGVIARQRGDGRGHRREVGDRDSGSA